MLTNRIAQARKDSAGDGFSEVGGLVHCRDDADASFLGLVANAALKANPAALLLLTGGAPLPSSKSAKPAPAVFVVAGPPGDLLLLFLI